jgi:hypothetical protein
MDSGGLKCFLMDNVEVMGARQLTHAEDASAKQWGLASEERNTTTDTYFLQSLQWCARGGLYRLHTRQNLGPPVFFLTS